MRLGLSSAIFGVFCAALMVMGTVLFAEAVPQRGKHDQRVRVTRHVDGQVFVIKTALTRATTVEFEQGERIVSVVAGDTASFLFQTIPGDRVFAIKPTSKGVKTNVTVYTDRRSYYFTLQEGNTPFYVVRFSYPQHARKSAGSIPIRKFLNSNYGANEEGLITPLSVWDDGAFTYFKFRQNAPVPAIFKVTNGRERSVNSQVIEHRVIRVSGTSTQWALRLGDRDVYIAEMSQ